MLSQIANRSESDSAFEVPVMRAVTDGLHLLLPMMPDAVLVSM